MQTYKGRTYRGRMQTYRGRTYRGRMGAARREKVLHEIRSYFRCNYVIINDYVILND